MSSKSRLWMLIVKSNKRRKTSRVADRRHAGWKPFSEGQDQVPSGSSGWLRSRLVVSDCLARMRLPKYLRAARSHGISCCLQRALCAADKRPRALVPLPRPQRESSRILTWLCPWQRASRRDQYASRPVSGCTHPLQCRAMRQSPHVVLDQDVPTAKRSAGAPS